MKKLIFILKRLFLSLFLFNFLIANAEDITPENKDKGAKQILIESNTQRSDFENSIFYAEGNVKITNPNEEFFAKSKKAVFYKLDGIIKLIGDAEVITNDSSKINAGEIYYYLDDNKFEAISNPNQRVNTIFILGNDKPIDQLRKKN